jgi:hypothetical protein
MKQKGENILHVRRRKEDMNHMYCRNAKRPRD